MKKERKGSWEWDRSLIIDKRILGVIIFFLLLFPLASVLANNLPDADRDGVPDRDEEQIYHTDPEDPDTDGDGYSDWEELNHGYSPHVVARVKLENSDYDQDGLNDAMELKFGTDLDSKDSDGDGYTDGEEVDHGYDPLNSEPVKLAKRIEINTSEQELSYFLGGVRMGKFLISSGVPSMPTPKGHFRIRNKHPKAWSSYGLWMPYWMALGSGRFGIHQLPVWPSGHREGEEHLGQPASHGCVRVGLEAAKILYDWTPVGTPVFIY